MSQRDEAPMVGRVGPVPGARIAILCSRFNAHVVERLHRGARRALLRHGVPPESWDTFEVPGAWELPVVASRLASSGRYAGVLVLSAVVRGETPHFEFVASAAAQGLARVALDHGVPVGFGLLTTDETAQALERAGGKAGDKGAEAALALLETMNLLRWLDDEGSAQGT